MTSYGEEGSRMKKIRGDRCRIQYHISETSETASPASRHERKRPRFSQLNRDTLVRPGMAVAATLGQSENSRYVTRHVSAKLSDLILRSRSSARRSFGASRDLFSAGLAIYGRNSPACRSRTFCDLALLPSPPSSEPVGEIPRQIGDFRTLRRARRRRHSRQRWFDASFSHTTSRRRNMSDSA